MSLIKTVADLRKAGIKIDVKLDPDQILPAVERVESSLIKPLITRELFTALDTKYNTSAPTYATGEEKLIKYLQSWIAPAALLMKARQMGITADGSGTYKNKAADKWILSDTEQATWLESLQEEVTAARELVIEYLEETSTSTVLAQYFTSQVAAGFKALRIKDVEHFSRYHDIFPGWATFRSLRPFIRSLQFDRIKPLLNGYYNTFLALVPSSELEKDLVYSAERAIVKLSTAAAMKQRAVSVGPLGITIVDEKERYGKKVTASAEQIMNTYDALVSDGEKAISDMQAILLEMKPNGYVLPEEPIDINDPDSNLYFA